MIIGICSVHYCGYDLNCSSSLHRSLTYNTTRSTSCVSDRKSQLRTNADKRYLSIVTVYCEQHGEIYIATAKVQVQGATLMTAEECELGVCMCVCVCV